MDVIIWSRYILTSFFNIFQRKNIIIINEWFIGEKKSVYILNCNVDFQNNNYKKKKPLLNKSVEWLLLVQRKSDQRWWLTIFLLMYYYNFARFLNIALNAFFYIHSSTKNIWFNQISQRINAVTSMENWKYYFHNWLPRTKRKRKRTVMLFTVPYCSALVTATFFSTKFLLIKLLVSFTVDQSFLLVSFHVIHRKRKKNLDTRKKGMEISHEKTLQSSWVCCAILLKCNQMIWNKNHLLYCICIRYYIRHDYSRYYNKLVRKRFDRISASLSLWFFFLPFYFHFLWLLDPFVIAIAFRLTLPRALESFPSKVYNAIQPFRCRFFFRMR